MDLELQQTAEGIRKSITEYQQRNFLSFVEDTHIYSILKEGTMTSRMPSVSTILELFFEGFKPETTKAFKNCGGNKELEDALLAEWAETGVYAANQGSRVHFLLEQYLIAQYGNFKEVRQPIYTCDKTQIKDGDQMVKAGKEFLDLMHSRGAIMLDTEIVLGSVKLGYFGQPDNVWLMRTKDGRIGIVITDWKTNKPKNFKVHFYTKQMFYPFAKLPDTSLSHYYIQLPLYAKLLLEMLKGTKYGNIPFLGGVVVLLKKNGMFEEYKIPQDIVQTVLNMNVKNYL